MKNTLLLTAFTLATLFSFAQNGKVINDPNAQKRDAKGYHGIHIASGIDLYLSQGDAETVVVSSSDPEVRDQIRTEVRDGVLEIYIENHGWHWNWVNKHLKAYVSFKNIDELHASGGSDVFIEDAIKEDKLDLSLSGGSDLHGKLNIGNLSVTQTGGADSYVSGSAATLFVHVSGGSDFHGYDLASDNARVEAGGGSDAYLTVNKELTASAHGGSDVHYKGNGVIRESSTGGGGGISHRD
jgi:hypothetical protein